MTNTNKQKFFYIYNYKQSQFYIEHGIPVLEIGKGSKNDIYVKFPRNEESEKVFTKWIEKCKFVNGE